MEPKNAANRGPKDRRTCPCLHSREKALHLAMVDPGHQRLGTPGPASRQRRPGRGDRVSSKTTDTTPVPTIGVPTAPPLPDDLEALLRRLRLPHVRRHAPEVVATAKAQRREPVEVLKALLAEEVAGRERSALATRRTAAGFPTGKTFAAWQPELSSIPAPTQQALRTPGVGAPPGGPRRLRTVGHREDVPARSPRPARRRTETQGRLVHPRGPRRPAAPAPRRRSHGHQRAVLVAVTGRFHDRPGAVLTGP